MGLIPEDIIAQVIDRTDIVEVISSTVPLKRAGRNFKANCPFHNEKTPSFVVNPDKQIFHCFGCGTGGTVIKFIMQQDRLTFPEAVRVLAQKVNVVIPETAGGSTRTTSVRQDILKVNSLTAQYFHRNLISDKGSNAQAARGYLKNRGIDQKAAEGFQLGYAQDSWDGLINYLRSQNISLKLMEKAGLIVARENGKGFYDRFRNRIVFPIFDTQGQCRAFGARTMETDESTDTVGAKYINSPETPVYTKGQHLYGFHLAKQAIGRLDHVIITEGYLDCIIPFQAGVDHIVASLGTALTLEQIRLLRRYTKNVVMLFDMDPAGESAILRSLDTLIEEGINVKVAELTEGHDPDSFIREHGVEAFNERIAEAQTLFEYKLSILIKRYDASSIEGKARISGEMLQTVDKFPNEVLKTGYTKRLSEVLNVPQQALSSELNKVREMTGAKKVFGHGQEPKTSVPEQLRVVESDMLRLLLEEKSFIEATRKEIDPSDFQDKHIREIISRVFDLWEQGKEVNSTALINSFDDEGMQQLIARLMTQEILTAGDKKKMHADFINRMKKDRKKMQMKALQDQIKEAESQGNQHRLEDLLKEYDHLIREVSL